MMRPLSMQPLLRALRQSQSGSSHGVSRRITKCLTPFTPNSHIYSTAAIGHRIISTRSMCSRAPKDNAEKTDEQVMQEYESSEPRFESLSFYRTCTVMEFLGILQFMTKYYYYSESEDYESYRPIPFPSSVRADEHYMAMLKDEFSWDNIVSPFNKMMYSKLRRFGMWDFIQNFPAPTLHACDHGLLKKYNFDIFDFMAGSKEAVRRINFITTSRAFMEASAGAAGSTREDALLRDITHPMFYRQSREAMKEVSRNPVYMELQEIEVQRVNVNALMIEIVSEGDIASRPKKPDGASSPDGAEVSSEESLDHNTEALDYPLGSVVVTVQMMFETNEKFLPRLNPLHQKYAVLEPDSLPFKMDQVMRHSLTNAWTFRGCISGHVPLEWKVCGVGSVYFR